jgi:hypothetical protein
MKPFLLATLLAVAALSAPALAGGAPESAPAPRAAGGAAESPPAAAAESVPPTASPESGAPEADGEDVAALLQKLHELPPFAGLIIAGLGLILLLWGWRLVRFALMLWCAALVSGLAAGLVLPGLGTVAAIIAALLGALVGALLGRLVQKARGAVLGALFCGLIFALPGAITNNQLMLLALGGLGVVVGALLGWKAALHLDAINTSFLGATLMMIGCSVAGQNLNEVSQIVVMIAAFVGALLLGLFYQFKAIRKEGRAGRR